MVGSRRLENQPSDLVVDLVKMSSVQMCLMVVYQIVVVNDLVLEEDILT
jgi:hypothetical protein